MLYLVVKWIHILSATLLFGTGLGTAFHMYAAHRRGNVQGIAIATQNTVLADWVFTLTSGIVQPVSGAVLIYLAGWNPLSPWLIAVYILYAIALACWLPVVRLQINMRDLARQAADSAEDLPAEYFRNMSLWFILGWPAFVALLAIFWLMIAKPT